MVGSICCVCEQGDKLRKGDAHGYFQFGEDGTRVMPSGLNLNLRFDNALGGSTVLLLFERGRIGQFRVPASTSLDIFGF